MIAKNLWKASCTWMLLVFFVSLFHWSFAQKRDSTFFFKSDLSITNNGFSIIPAFTLGKPAALLDMKMGNNRLSFEPQFRFALEGRPGLLSLSIDTRRSTDQSFN